MRFLYRACYVLRILTQKIYSRYARFGDISAKSDVYSFGVVLFEIISAKDAIVHHVDKDSVTQAPRAGSHGLVTLVWASLLYRIARGGFKTSQRSCVLLIVEFQVTEVK